VAALPHQAQGTVQRSGSEVYPEQIGLYTVSGKLMSDTPPDTLGGRRKKRKEVEGSKRRG